MIKIKSDQIMVTYDKELGILYAPNKGIIKTTTPDHAQAIEECLSKYLNNQMDVQDIREFESYIEKYFGDAEDLPIAECKNLKERDVLRRLELVLANDCNLRCRYCYAHGGTYDMKVQRMTPNIACEYIQKLLIGKYRYVEIVTFFGGEPTLCPLTIKAVCDFFAENVGNGVFEKMPKFLMISNGTLIDESMADLIHEYNIGITISIDGPQEINDLLRVDAMGNGTFTKISQGIDLLNKVGSLPLLLEATYTSKHKEMGYTKECVHDYLKKRFNTQKVMVADCCSGGIEKDLEYVDWDTHIQDDGKELFCDIGHTYNCLKQTKISDIGCDVAFGSVTLMPNGEIYPCHFFVKHPEYKIAYYHNEHFDFSNYENVLLKFDSIRKTKNPRCTDCWAKSVCLSCPAQLLLENDEKKVNADCYTRNIIEKYLILKCAKASYAKA